MKEKNYVGQTFLKLMPEQNIVIIGNFQLLYTANWNRGQIKDLKTIMLEYIKTHHID